jgi:hypothetical protein
VDVLAEEVEEDVGVDLSAGVVCIHNRQVDDCVTDDEEMLIEGGQVDVLAEEVEEDVGVDLSAGVVCKKYEEPESCGCAADFLLGEEMKGDPSGREELEAAAMKINDSNKVNAFLLQ